jgi:hypothetical protein
MDNQNFPKFIQSKPTGEDEFEGRSAEKVAIAIQSYIEKTKNLNKINANQKLPQIIGLEGGWGSGKSNVIKKLKTNIKKDYYLFEYDAWGNQEDLQRRSFLEQLTQELIDEEILDGNTEIIKRGGGKETVTWKDKLKYLLARKTETISEKYPRISNGMAASGIVAILTPIFVFIAYATKPQNNSWWSILLSIFISMLPVIVCIGIWMIACKKDIKYKDFGYLLAIYTDKITNDVNYETISEDEPTVSEFKGWMNDISNFIKNNDKKNLIVVFDNMDRLPADKVKELWSSIHTFFSEDGYENIWVIITFDKKHLANAFGDGDCDVDRITKEKEKKELASQFIAKTFPIIYRVAPPVITDRKKIFYKFFTDAFDTTEDDSKEKIQRIFSLIKSDFTPRDVITFINELVSLKQTWTDKINLVSMSVFALIKDDILDKPVENILSGKYLEKEKIYRIIDNTEIFQGEIAALAYGIDIKFAEQIPLTQYLQNCLAGKDNFDINKYSDRTYFVTILDNIIQNIETAIIDETIINLSKLDHSKGIDITKQWNDLVKLHLQRQIVKLSFEKTHEELLLNSDDINKNNFTKYLCRNFRELKDFKGDLFYQTMRQLDNYIKENKLNIVISNSIETKKVTPDIFIEYVNQAKNNYQQFKLNCDNKALNEYLVGLIPEKLPIMDFIEFLIKDKSYSFNILRNRIEYAIANNEMSVNGFPEIIKTYKIISDDKPLKQQFNQAQIQSFLNSITDKTSEAYYDLVAMGLTQSIDTAHVENLDEKIAERIEYYGNYGPLLLLTKTWSSGLLFKVVKKLTEKSYGTSKLDILKVLPLFEQIKNIIGVSEVDFLNRLNGWSGSAKEKVNADNISTLIPDFKFYKYSTETIIELTKHINKTIISKLENIPADDLYLQRNTPTDYWLNCAAILIQNGIIKTLPNNLKDFCKKILIAISEGPGIQAIPAPGSIIDVIIKRADKRTCNQPLRIFV